MRYLLFLAVLASGTTLSHSPANPLTHLRIPTPL